MNNCFKTKFLKMRAINGRTQLIHYYRHCRYNLAILLCLISIAKSIYIRIFYPTIHIQTLSIKLYTNPKSKNVTYSSYNSFIYDITIHNNY